MKPALRLCFALIILLSCSSWGFFAHYRIHHLAVFVLPKGMAAFYRSNIDYITEHAITADKRRYVDSTEAPHHFFDADFYGKVPFKTMPHKWADAATRYNKDTLVKYGTVPWSIQYEYYRLIRAFKAHDTTDILHTSADLGHYVSDACVPLHTTMNYDGQLTNQKGIHALWESRLPEQFANQYHLYIGKARYIDNPLSEAFILCRSSFKEVDSVIHFEQMLSRNFPPDKKYNQQQRGTRKVTDYSPEYCTAYNRLMYGMVERRMRTAILAVGSYWYSAWVDAGQPDLNKLIAVKMSTGEKIKLDKEELAFKGAVVNHVRKK